MDHEQPVTWKVATQVWWSITWRVLAYLVAIGFVLGAGAKLFEMSSSESGGSIKEFAQGAVGVTLYLLVVVLVPIYAVKQALAVKWVEFRIAIQRRD